MNITFVDKCSTKQLLYSLMLEELSAPILKISTIHDHSSPCSLLEAHINVPNRCLSRTRQVAYCLRKLLEVMCYVQKLMLSSTAAMVLSSVDELCSCLPVFPNLKLLDFGRLDLRLPVIIKLLHNAPHLETLQLSEIFSCCKCVMCKIFSPHFYNQGIKYPSVDEDGAILDPAPHCFGFHLRQIQLYDFFPPHAMVLEKFTVYCKWLPSERRTEETIQEMSLEIH
ncbi:hypothetical protein ACJRO7_021887 [Eucalyptus globulus]|uniref:Uncharacterized protein n=1 Tax=Eucalyptus globulus TaxID=34317 RepID=A0ABD3KM60_EUCGL